MTSMIDTSIPMPAGPLAGPSTSSRGIAPDKIFGLFVQRKNKNMAVIAAGQRIQKVYDGDFETAMPELEKREKTQVANLVNQGVEGVSMRIGSTMPNMYFPPENTSRAARIRAADRLQVVKAWHEMNKMDLLFRQRARHITTLATSPVYIRPGSMSDGEEMYKVPIWEIWDPLSTFASDMGPGEMVPHDVVHAFKRSWQWLQDTYHIGTARLPLHKNMNPNSMVDVLMYCDPDEMVMICVGKDGDGANMPAVELQRIPNLTGKPCVVVPARITLGRLQGMFDQMIGMYEAQGLVWAMHLQALKRSIFPETWLQARPNEDANIIVPANALTGEVGEVEGGQLVSFRSDPSVQTGQTLDRQERNMRQTGGIPAELGGESGSNIRTARRGTQVLSSAIDFPIQEHQDILAASLHEENKIAIAIAKAYWPSAEKTLLVSFGDGAVTYTPEVTFPFDNHAVRYAFSGVSADGLVVEGLQRLGAGVLSDIGFMEIDPLISDPIFEKARIDGEQLRKALMASIQQQMADPNSPYTPEDAAWLVMAVEDRKKDLPEAVVELQKRVQDRQNQAQQGALPPEQMQPGLAPQGAPGTPGAAAPGAPGPTENQQGLAALMSSLRTTQRGAPAVTPPGNV